jgi:OOP family OmpA-OmpF porin
MAGRDDGMTSTIEVQLGIGATFGTRRVQQRVVIEAPPVAPKVEEEDTTDSDRDGIPDRIDRCAAHAETVNGDTDGDGCPEEDGDGDGIAGLADLCPDAPEDRDGFRDEDGCIEADNDGDGIEDIHDKCPLEAETRNGVDDGDGCGDAIPPDVANALAVSIAFTARSAKLGGKQTDALLPVLSMLAARTDVRIVITGRPEQAKGDNLAKRRAEAVKWFLVDRGIAEDRIATAVGEIGTPAIELTLAVAPAK